MKGVVKLKKTRKAKVLSPQEIAKNFDISYQTLNYYTSLGLLHPQSRQGNKRLYAAGDIKERLERIFELKNAGYPLRIISDIMNGHKKVL